MYISILAIILNGKLNLTVPFSINICIYIYFFKKNKNRLHKDYKFISILLWVLIWSPVILGVIDSYQYP